MRRWMCAGVLAIGAACATRGAPSALPAVSLVSLRDGVFMHRSWHTLPEGTFAANGLLLASGALVDTTWTGEEAEQLYTLARERGILIEAAIATHAHDDRVGGIGALAKHGVTSFGLARTQREARAHGLPAPSQALDEAGTLRVGESELAYFYPGPAHAPDNLVVYLPAQQILFGGCMVRALDGGLGPFTEASLVPWRDALRRVMARFPEATLIVPGHGEPGGRELLDHTLSLIEAQLAASSG